MPALTRQLSARSHLGNRRVCHSSATTGTSTLPVLLTHPDRNTQNERRATQSNTRQRTQGKQNQRSRNNTSKPKTNTADPEHYSKPPTTENRNLRTNRKPLPSKPTPKAYLNHTVQANQTCQGPPWILPVTPVSTGRVQATSKHLTASLRVECVPGTQPHKPVRPTAGRARRNPSTLGSDRAADARAIRRSRCAESQPNQPAEVADVRRLAPPASLH